MKRISTFFAVFCILLMTALTDDLMQSSRTTKAQNQSSPANAQSTAAAPTGDGFVYADFETLKDNRPVSNGGGLIQLISYQESTPSHFKGLANSSPPAPESVHLKKDDPNHAIAFDYELYSPNQYAGVGVEMQGHPLQDGKTVADDVSAYKFLSMQIYATGVTVLRVELMSRGQGISLASGFPQMSFKLKPGFNIYKIPLSSLSQPSWAQTKVNTKDVLKKLTAVSLTAYCEQCAPVNGTIVVDNLVFQK
jgi:hypothetical protein